jgi:putative endonuclease
LEVNTYYIYILTNQNNKILYTGVTNDLARRCFEHQKKIFGGFTSKYNVNKLVYYEEFDLIIDAIEREKQIKGYSRKKKIVLIERFNIGWKDLYVSGCIYTP